MSFSTVLETAEQTVAVTNQTVSPPAATASASSPVPVSQLQVSPAAATASASSPLPVPQLRISPAAASASASGPVPVPDVKVPPGAATASASGLVPTVSTSGGGGTIAYVRSQGTTAQTGGSLTISMNLAADVASGNVIVVWVGASSGTLTTMNSVTNVTWFYGASSLNNASNASAGLAVGVASALIPAGTAITANIDINSTRRGMVIEEFSTVDNTTPINTSAVASGAAGSDAAPSISPSGSGLALVSFNMMNATITDMLVPTSPASFTETSDFDIGTSTIKHMTSAYLLGQGSGTYAPTHTVGTGTRGAAEGAAAALNPASGATNQTVSPPAATASASSLVPVPQLSIPAPVASANASAPLPVPQLRVSPAAATASASSPTPVPQIRITVPVATASANSPPAVLPIAAPAATASGSSPAPVMPIKVGRNGIVLGYSNQLLTGTQAQDAEKLIGRTFRGLRQNQDISVTGWSTAVTEYALGRTLTYRAIQINSGLWSDVTAGTHDTELLAIASNLVAAGLWSPSNPAYICFHHEVTLSSNSVFGTGQDYINAWRHVRDLWDANGYTVRKKTGEFNGGPIIMVLVHFLRAFTNTLELGGTETPPAGSAHADYDPDGGTSPAPAGTSYYEGIGIDAYNSITSAGHLKYGTTASNLYGGSVAQAAATGKFTFFGENGCEDGATTTDHTNKADWWDSVNSYLGSLIGTPQQPRALLLTIKSGAENYNVDSSSQATAAFARLGQDPDFYPNQATAFGQTPGVDVKVVVPAATASASAPIPTVSASTGNQTVSPPAATSSASSPVPVPQLKVSPAAATASASAPSSLVPAIAPPKAGAYASSPTMLGKKGMRVDATLSLATMQSRLDALKADGVEHVRCTAAWPTIETADETFSWTTTDRVFTQASNRGMSVSFTVDGMPGWLNANGYWTPPRTGTELAQWQAFATTMAARYANQGEDGSGPIYECWNEPDQGVFWLAQGGGSAPDPAEYATVLHDFYVGIKAGDPNARVAGMVVNRTRLGYIGAVYDALESQYGVATCRANNYFFDLLALHPYCLTHPPDYPTTDDTTDTWGVVARRFLDFRRAYDLVWQREGVRKNLIFGEFGYSTTSGPNGPVTDATRATYIPLAYSGIRSEGYVHSLTWYTYADASNADFDIQSTTSETAYKAVAQSGSPLDVKVPPGAGTASASAPTPTVVGNQIVSPPAATASASSPVPTPQLKVSPAAATASASAPLPTPKDTVPPAAATATASAPVPNVLTSGAVFPPAATASASSPVPVPQVQLTPPVSTASASSLVSVPQLRAIPPAATSNASAPPPSVQVGLTAPAATATSSAFTPTLQLRLTPAVTVANASAPTPAVQIRLAPPVATASASALVPSIKVTVLPPAGSANASAFAPTISGVIDQIVLPPVAAVSASALTPVVTAQSTVVVPVAMAIALALIPNVIMPQWPTDTGLQWPPDSNLQWPPDTNERW